MPKRNLTQAVKSLRSAIGSKPRNFCIFDDDLRTVCNLFCVILISWVVLLGTVKIPAIIRDNDAQAAANEQPHECGTMLYVFGALYWDYGALL